MFPEIPFIDALMEIVNHYAGNFYQWFMMMSEIFPLLGDVYDLTVTFVDVIPEEFAFIPLFFLGYWIIEFTVKGEK